MSGFTDIRYEVEDPCAIITLNRPDQLNAFTHRTLNELRTAFAAAHADTSVVGIIVTAPDAVEGARSFVERHPPRFERVGR